jgi:hypothetical protein
MTLLLMILTPMLAQAEVRGLYGTKCLEGNGVSAIKDLLLRDEIMETVQTVYSDRFCENPSYDFSFSGPYVYQEETGYFDYDYASIKLQALDQKVVEQFNEVALCGFQDWSLGRPKEVSGLDCGGQLLPSIGTRAFDLIHEKGASSNPSLQLGRITEMNNGLSPESRPSEVEDLTYFPK